MLSIILLIFKVIGTIILVLLGILLFLILAVLIVPVRYRIAIEHGNGKLYVRGTISWLLHIIHANVLHKGGRNHIQLRLFGIAVFDSRKPATRSGRGRRLSKKKSRKPSGKRRDLRSTDSCHEDTKPEYIELDDVVKKKTRHEDTGPKDSEADVIDSEDTGQYGSADSNLHNRFTENKEADHVDDHVIWKAAKERQSFFERIRHRLNSLKERLITFLRSLYDRITGSVKRILDIGRRIHLLSEFIKNEINREAIRLSYDSAKKLAKHIFPRKLRSSLVFGTGDPSTTGQALGALGMIYGFYGDNIHITPDFENARFEGKHYAKGRIRIGAILIIVIKLLLDKRFKKFTRNMKTLKEAL